MEILHIAVRTQKTVLKNFRVLRVFQVFFPTYFTLHSLFSICVCKYMYIQTPPLAVLSRVEHETVVATVRRTESQNRR